MRREGLWEEGNSITLRRDVTTQPILANSDSNFVVTEISVNQVRKCFPVMGVGVFASQEQPSSGLFAKCFCTFSQIGVGPQ